MTRRFLDIDAFMENTRIKVIAGCIFISAACFIAYIPAIRGGFIWDDDLYVTDNSSLTAPHGLYRIWFTMNDSPQCVPFVYATICTTFWVEHQLWGFDPMGYHVVNVGIHIANALLLWLVLRRLLIPGAWFVSAVFALHPVQVESVAWITELKNTMMVFFALLTILCWMQFAVFQRSGRRAYVGSLLLYALSLSSKSTACTLPAAFVLILWFKRVPITAKRWLQIVPFVAMGIGTGFLVMWREQRLGTGFHNLGLGLAEKLLIAGRALWFYLWKLFWPVNLTFSYPRWEINSSEPLQYIWLILCIITAAGLWICRKKLGRGVIAAVLLFVATLFPMLGFFNLYTFMYTWVADHYQYMASIALITLVVAAGSRLIARLGKYAKTAKVLIAFVLLLTCAILTWRQCRIYGNLETLWRDTIKKNPDSWLAHNNLGNICNDQGKNDERIYHTTRAIEIAQRNPAVPSFNIAYMRCNIANALQSQGKIQEAIEQLKKAIEIFPNDPKIYFALADLLVSQNLLDDAVVYLEKTVQLVPNNGDLYCQIAGIMSKKGDIYNVITNLHRALDINPGYVRALSGLVDLSINNPNPEVRGQVKAVEYARRAVQYTNRQNPAILNFLAMALASDKQFAEAAATAEEALNMALAAGSNDLAGYIRTQLESYKKQLN